MTISRLRFRLLLLTLVAFGMQVVCADFHHHLTRGTGMEARALTAGMCRSSRDHSCAPVKHDHDGCVLCWAAAIAATSLTPILFHMPPPSVVAGIRLRAIEPSQSRVVRLAETRARGPPDADLG